MVKQNITNINARRELLLTPADVMQILGVGRDSAMKIMRAHGLHLGRLWYITRDQLNRALDQMAGSGIRY